MAKEIEVQTDSQLVVKQFTGEYEIKGPSMIRYAARLKKMAAEFDSWKVVKIDITRNGKADALAKLATASQAVDLRSIVLIGKDISILEEVHVLAIEEENWMTELKGWLANGLLPNN